MSYIPGQPWFICDRCSQKWRLRNRRKEWTGFIVCPPCLDPRPPELTPPVIYPEGVPIPDARPPQDGPQTGTNPETTNYITTPITRNDL